MEVEAIGNFILLLNTGIYLDLKETFIVLSFRRNLVSIYVLDNWVILVFSEIVSLVFI